MTIVFKSLGLQPYETTWQAMQTFTNQRLDSTPDEIWFVEHPPVFTQGLNGKPEHLLQQTADIPIVQTDRGGQITYHAPGQVILYILVDLKRAKLGVRALVSLIEAAIVEYLQQHNIHSQARSDAPGVYVKDQKIASLGLKIRKQKSYHGLALNVAMDLTPFQCINPCGLNGMQMTQLHDLLPAENRPSTARVAEQLSAILIRHLNPLSA